MCSWTLKRTILEIRIRTYMISQDLRDWKIIARILVCINESSFNFCIWILQTIFHHIKHKNITKITHIISTEWEYHNRYLMVTFYYNLFQIYCIADFPSWDYTHSKVKCFTDQERIGRGTRVREKKFVVDYYTFIWYNSNQYSQGHLSRWINLQFLSKPLQFKTAV